MKKFRVIVWEECTWEKVIEADTWDEAESKAYEDISGNGYDSWQSGDHGANEITDVQEIK
tara:strand:+ start:197 stop:376 length:180 start_codon:yes stop_codon:yes gene_type:complete